MATHSLSRRIALDRERARIVRPRASQRGGRRRSLRLRLAQLERDIQRRIARRDPAVPLLTASVGVGALFLVVLAVFAAIPTRVSPHEAFLDGAAVIGVIAFLVALPALGYAVRTDFAVANLDTEARSDIIAAKITEQDELAVSPGVAPADTLPVGQPLDVVKARGLLYEIRSPLDVPQRVLDDLLKLGTSQSGLKAGSIMTKLDYAARASGKGNANAPWLFGLEDRDELWRLSYGGEGNNIPELRLLGVATAGARNYVQAGEIDGDVREMLIDVAAASDPHHQELDGLRRISVEPKPTGRGSGKCPSFCDALDRARSLGASRPRVERVARELRAARLLQFNEPLEDDTKLTLRLSHAISPKGGT
jgi:hypothetical protein